MHRLPFAVAATVALMAGSLEAAAPLPSAENDPLHSPACVAALKSLQAQEAGLSGERPRAAPPPGLIAERRRAAIACLASRADPPPSPQRMAQPPIVVAPVSAGSTAGGSTGYSGPTTDAASIAVTRGASAATLPPVTPVLPSPAPPKPAPTTLWSCDTLGCWANDGSRLNRVGPNLWGPRGACTAQGALLQCP